jgi:hypothetical protein
MKKFFQKVGAFFALLFGGAKKFEQFLIDHVDDAIDIVNKIRNIVENPVILTIMSVLPDKYKNAAGEVLQKIQSTLDKVLADLSIANDCLQKPTFIERLKCFTEKLKKLTPVEREAYYKAIAAAYVKYHPDNKQPLADSAINAIVETRFLDRKNSISA